MIDGLELTQELGAEDLEAEAPAEDGWLILAGRAFLFGFTCTLLFLGSLLAAGAAAHALRGPHQHHPCNSTRGNCIDAR